MQMNIVKRYGLAKKELQTVSIPKNAKILSVCVVHEHINVFVELDQNNLYDFSQTIEFAIFKDGQYFPTDRYQFLGSVVLEFGNAVYHVLYHTI